VSSHQTPLAAQASVLLPAATSFETDGSFVNATGKAQGFKRALQPQGDAAPGWELLARLGRAMGLDLAYTRLRDVRAALLARAPLAHPDHTPAAPASEAPAESATTA
jgi:NADH-quinone oxidoreductase subunit G